MSRCMARIPLTMTFWCAAAAAWACETPVYRYAMYRWTPLPYEAYYFHRGQVSQADQEVHRVLADMGKDGTAANVLITPIDLDRKDALDGLPEPVKKLWQAQGGKLLPSYLVFTPWGSEILAGQLDAKGARELTQSSLRTEIGKMFDQGCGVVLLIVCGDKPEQNARMEAAARSVIAVAGAGKLFEDPTAAPDVPAPPKSPEGQEPVGEPGGARGALRVGLVKLDAAKTPEPWLLKILAAMTPDSQQEKISREPMLFAIYGRGRVMPPGIGEEVTAESLSGLLRFLGDRCSCTIKDQNPGLDLLMRWDWEATAERMAAGEEAAARPPLYAEMPADGETPSSSPPAAKEVHEPPAAPTIAAAGVAATSDPIPPATTQSPPSSVAPAPAPVAEVSQTDDSADGFASRQRWQLGLGVAALALVVLAAGFMILRRQQHASP